MTVKEAKQKIEKEGKVFSHTSHVRVYVSRKNRYDGENLGYAEVYEGRFGKGYAIYSPNWKSSRYSFITYYV